MFNQEYYNQRKAEIQADYQKLVIECQEDCERAVIKKVQKSQELQKKMQVVETQEKESLEKSKPKKDGK